MGNVKFFTFLSSCICSLESCFFVLEYHETHFPICYMLLTLLVIRFFYSLKRRFFTIIS